MPTPAEAEEHLRVIRSLMERATTYRAISAPGALVGGVLAIAASFAFGNWILPSAHEPFGPSGVELESFLGLWLGVLVLTTGVNFGFLWREARRRGDLFLSPGMRMALRAVLPSYAVAAFVTMVTDSDGGGVLVSVWLLCHGLGLLATSHFAPRSFFRLGWAFLLAGMGALVLCAHDDVLAMQMWMGLTFGVFHLIYAVCAWPRKQPEAIPALAP